MPSSNLIDRLVDDWSSIVKVEDMDHQGALDLDDIAYRDIEKGSQRKYKGCDGQFDFVDH